MLGGMRVLVIENLPWHEGQKHLATVGVYSAAALAALAFLARAV